MAPTRLINTHTLAFETRFGSLRKGDPGYPRFTIISHRWEDQEISYQEFLYFTSPPSDRNSTVARILGLDLSKENGKGFWKVRSACHLAKARGYDWLWLDTCCINKDSSAELSEAINSMYEWYRDAAECWVYLSTVTAARVKFSDFRNEFWTSEWWQRGWTLQELVAPQSLKFLDQNWQDLISRDDLGQSIAAKTGIPSECFGNQDRIQSTAIATRMSWARSRKTSRLEDTAYSLLGICGINMPLLYGEGTRAFRRLQEAIIARSDDETIFAVNKEHAGLLATSPSDFSAQPVTRTNLCLASTNRTFSMIQTGVSMSVSYLDMSKDVWAVVFNCKHASPDQSVIRLFDAIPSRFGFQTARLSVRSGPADGPILQRAYEKVAGKFSSRKECYKFENAVLLTES